MVIPPPHIDIMHMVDYDRLSVFRSAVQHDVFPAFRIRTLDLPQEYVRVGSIRDPLHNPHVQIVIVGGQLENVLKFQKACREKEK